MSETDISDLLDPPRRARRTGVRRTRLKDLPETHLRKLVERLGGVAKAAAAWSVTRQSLYLWLHAGFVSPERALEIERVTPKVDRFDLMSPEQVAIWRGRRTKA